jgi:hypothetical protein
MPCVAAIAINVGKLKSGWPAHAPFTARRTSSKRVGSFMPLTLNVDARIAESTVVANFATPVL